MGKSTRFIRSAIKGYVNGLNEKGLKTILKENESIRVLNKIKPNQKS